MAKQVHGTKLLWASERELKKTEADALATSELELPIAVQTADCAPVLFVPLDSSGSAKAVLLVHAGWRGTARHIVERAVEEFVQKVQGVKSLVAVIGPCISKEAFEVGQDVMDAFPHVKPNSKGIVNGREKFYFDLEAENFRQLEAVSKRLSLNIAVDRLQLCTHSDPEAFPSYRRDGATGERIISFIELSK